MGVRFWPKAEAQVASFSVSFGELAAARRDYSTLPCVLLNSESRGLRITASNRNTLKHVRKLEIKVLDLV